MFFFFQAYEVALKKKKKTKKKTTRVREAQVYFIAFLFFLVGVGGRENPHPQHHKNFYSQQVVGWVSKISPHARPILVLHEEDDFFTPPYNLRTAYPRGEYRGFAGIKINFFFIIFFLHFLGGRQGGRFSINHPTPHP